MPWFKWWDGTAADMKFRMVAEDCKLPVACIVGAWAYLLEHASRSVDRGSIADVDFELMAYTLQIPDCETVCNAMKRRKLLHETGTITKWEDRQGKREKSEPAGASTERVQRYREKKKQSENKGLPAANAGDDGNGGETDVTGGNGEKRPKKKNREEEDKEPKTLTPSSADAAGETVGKVKPFDQFWDVYPNRVAKIAAQKAWAKLKLDAKVGEIVAAVEAQKEGHHWRNEGGRFIPNPATWLNAGRWLDEVRPYVAPPPKLPNGWWETHDSLKAAGLMLNPPLTPNTGERKEDFRRRINQAIGVYDKEQVPHLVEPPQKLDRPYIPPAPPAGVQLTAEQLEARKLEMREQLAKLKQAGNLATAGIAAANSAADTAAKAA